MKRTIIILSTILLLAFIKWNVGSSEKLIPDSAIRLRVVAHSNTPYDQQVKSKIRDTLQKELYVLLGDTSSINDARIIIKKGLPHLDSVVANELKTMEYNRKHNISYGYNYFPSKTYKGIEYDDGYYESLLVTIGAGKGDNWWCVLFPPLCLLEADEAEEVEYKFFVTEIINKYIKR